MCIRDRFCRGSALGLPPLESGAGQAAGQRQSRIKRHAAAHTFCTDRQNWAGNAAIFAIHIDTVGILGYKYSVALCACGWQPRQESVKREYPGRLARILSDERTGSPLPGASILIKGTYLWAVSDQKGEFTIQGIQEGKYQLEVSFLGYVPATVPVNVNNSIKGLKIQLKENTLALNDVIVTAQAPKTELNTTLNIGSNALEHLQISNVSDISALLPGGKTKVPDLTSNNIFSLRDGGSSAGNAAFGTAIEVDGVRIGNNSSFGNMTGIDTRSISVADIESVEVITGVPSAEYGDLNSGMVKIHTKKGKTPWNVLLSINPRTEQVSFSKGLDLGNDKGIVNISGEWIKATQKLNSPYTSYTRRGFSAGYSNTFRKVLRFCLLYTSPSPRD